MPGCGRNIPPRVCQLHPRDQSHHAGHQPHHPRNPPHDNLRAHRPRHRRRRRATICHPRGDRARHHPHDHQRNQRPACRRRVEQNPRQQCHRHPLTGHPIPHPLLPACRRRHLRQRHRLHHSRVHDHHRLGHLHGCMALLPHCRPHRAHPGPRHLRGVAPHRPPQPRPQRHR